MQSSSSSIERNINTNTNTKNKKSLESLRESVNLYSLFTRKYFTSWLTLYIFLVPLVLIFSWAMIFPMQYSTSLVLGMSLGFSTLFVYGIYFFTFRKSVLYKMIETSSFGKMDLYFSILFLILLSNILVIIYVIGIYVILGTFGVLVMNFAPPIGAADMYNQNKILTPSVGFFSTNWGVVIYYYFIYTFVTFALAFLFQNLTKSSISFFILSSTYLVILIFFGGMMVSGCSTYATGILHWTDEAAGEGTFFLNPDQIYSYDSDSNTILLYPVFIEIVIGAPDEYYAWRVGDTQIDNFPWWISQFIPVYGLNSYCYSMFLTQAFNEGITVCTYYNGELYYFESGATINLKYFSFFSGYYFWLFISPYVWIIIYILIGVFFEKKQKN